MIIESPLEIIFRDLFYRLRSFARGHDVFLKLEGFNVSGSIKVKTAIALIEDLERRGIARPHETVIVESSSGNLGIALSLVCAIKGYKFICVTDSNSTRANIRGMELYGATVLVVKNRDPDGGFLRSRFRAIEDILQSEPNAVWLNQHNNIANKNVHAAETAVEIANEFEKVDWIFVGTGTTGTLGGISERLRHEFPNIKVVAVDRTLDCRAGNNVEDRGSRQVSSPCQHFGLRRDDILYPGRVVDRVQILVAEVRGDGDDGVAWRELRGQLPHGGEDASSASANKQMIVAHERQARFDRRRFVDLDDPVRIGQVREFRPQTRSDTGNVSLTRTAPERDGADRLDGHDLDVWKLLTKAL